MRISDWSSDVCSSDLSEVERIRSDYALALDRAGQWREAEASYRLTQSRLASAPDTLRYSSYAHNLGTLESRLGHYAESERQLREAIDKIGRASWKESGVTLV